MLQTGIQWTKRVNSLESTTKMPPRQKRSRLSSTWRWILLTVIPFFCGRQVHRIYPPYTHQDFVGVLANQVLLVSHITTKLAGTASMWRVNVHIFMVKLLEIMGDLSSRPDIHFLWVGTVLVLVVLLGVTVWTLMQLWRRRKDQRSLRPDIKGDDGMEILRTSRNRSSTFDFFGTHTEQQPRERAWSSSSALEMVDFRRERVGSMDLFYSQREALKKDQRPKRKLSYTSSSQPTSEAHIDTVSQNEACCRDDRDDEAYLFDEFGLVTLSYDVVYYGPSKTSLRYETWTPPTSWSEVSRRIVPQDIMLKLRRSLEIELSEGNLSIREPKSTRKWELSLPAQNFSIHVKQPAEGAVVNLYAKPMNKDEWMEHTFESAQHAAQFQLDLLAYQALGKTLNYLFQALSLVHWGSIACEQPEHVLHYTDDSDETGETERTSAIAAVAWDDAMRALSSIPTVRIALERLWLHRCRPVNGFPTRKKGTVGPSKNAASLAENDLLTEEYAGKRLLLGPVDFFRLFVPALPDTAVPLIGCNRARMEQLLSWRKRAARASVLARAYVAAHRVVNVGWELSSRDDNSPRTLRRRLAYDDNEHNNRRDLSGKDEIYEASVSRDVLCHVRPFDYFSQPEATKKQKKSLVLSPYQAYALIGIHVFRKPENYYASFPLNPSRDPVEVIPSLREIIASNPDVDFLVTIYHRPDTVSILLHGRSLAKGIDPQFDNVMKRFTEGGAEIRDRKVHMMIQMGHSHTLSFLGVILVRFLSFLFSLTRKGRESPLGLQARRDRVPFPAIRLATYGDTRHFGGSLRGNNDLPANYIGISTAFEPRAMPNLISRILFSYLAGQVSQRVLDFTLVLEGENEDELPERALCTARLVCLDTLAVSKDPAMYDFVRQDLYANLAGEAQSSELWPRRLVSEFASVVQFSFLTPKKKEASRMADVANVKEYPNHKNLMQPEQSALVEDSIRAAIDEVWALLEGVKVPVKANANCGYLQNYGSQSDFGLPNNMVMTPVIGTLAWHDIRRFIISCGYNLQEAAVRIVKTAAWRGQTFPTDTRMCRIELQSGQVFHYGHDVGGNPVVYFRTMCRGPWRQCAEATLAAALHRFEMALSEFCAIEQEVKCTLVIVLGRPGKSTRSDPEGSKQSNNNTDEDSPRVDNEGLGESVNDDMVGVTIDPRTTTNPRVSPEEQWYLHCTSDLLEQFISLLFKHYPERIAKVLLVKGKGQKASFYRTHVAASRAMKRAITVRKERSKIRFLPKMSTLKVLIDESELSAAALGKAPVPLRAFEC